MKVSDFPSLPNNSALGRGIRVGLSGGNLAAVGDDADELGTIADNVLATDPVAAVIPLNYYGVKQYVASGAITQYAIVYAAADGKIAATGTLRRGIALEAASGDGAIIQVLHQGGSNPSV